MSGLPKLVRLYIQQVLIGFCISIAFVTMLLLANVGNLQHLIFNTSGGYLALFLLVFFNGLLFAGVQFAISVMRMAEQPDDDPGGKRLLDGHARLREGLTPPPARSRAAQAVRR